MDVELDRRKFLQRTGVAGAVAGGIWAAPAVFGSTSAFAVGSTVSCPDESAFSGWTSTGTGQVGSTLAKTWDGGSGGAATTATFTSLATDTTLLTRNFQIGTVRGVKALQIDQYEGEGGGYELGYQEVTLEFSHPVTGLSFDIRNFTFQRGGTARRWWEFFIEPFVPESPGTVAYDKRGPGQMDGTGTSTTVFKRNGQTPGVPTSGSDTSYAVLNVAIGGPVTSLKMHFDAYGRNSYDATGWPADFPWPMGIANLNFCRTA